LRAFWNRINWQGNTAAKFCATYSDEAIFFFVALDKDTTPHHAFVLNLKAIRSGRGVRWWVYKFHHGIMDADRLWLGTSAAAVAHGMAGEIHPVVMTDNGYPMIIGAGYRDGLHPFLLA